MAVAAQMAMKPRRRKGGSGPALHGMRAEIGIEGLEGEHGRIGEAPIARRQRATTGNSTLDP